VAGDIAGPGLIVSVLGGYGLRQQPIPARPDHPHRTGFKLFWTWKSRRHGPGRPAVAPEIRALIRRMSEANALWGAPRIHGELQKLGLEISQATVSK
jgi:hypothetical protein